LSYYEDLGVAPDASPEQIRETYRALARLLHPDPHTDPVLKRAAEGQMRRLNAIYAVLSDPERRRRYDAQQNGYVEAPVPVPMVMRTPKAVLVRTRIGTGSLIWMGAAVVSVGAIFWLSVQGQSKPWRNTQVRAAEAQASQTYGQMEPAEPAVTARRANEIRREEKLSVLPPVPPPVREVETLEPPPRVETPPLELPPALALQPPLPALAEKHFGGFWAYMYDRNFRRKAGTYAPQFIETSIEEKDGAIHGKFKARYLIPDRPVSPNVRFEFEGKPEGTSAKLPWKGEGGSQGELEIHLISATEMEFIWHATELGQSLALGSGTAILLRRPE
jgi:DnaJ domain